MYKKSLEFTVGLFVLAGIAALAMLSFKVGNLSTSQGGSSYTVTANFDNIGGLKIKAPVTMAGVRIGRVTAISVDREDFSAVVSLAIESQYDNLSSDSSASVLTSGLLGAQYVGLEVGGEETHLKSGDQIELTQSAVVLEQLIGQILFSEAEGG